MLVTGVHFSKENRPQMPMITDTCSTPSHQKDLHEGIFSTAAAVVKAVTKNAPSSSVVQSPQINQTISGSVMPQCSSQVLGISPDKVSEIRYKGYSQLATLKQLYEKSVLTLCDFEY